jgi:hypothetical protein
MQLPERKTFIMKKDEPCHVSYRQAMPDCGIRHLWYFHIRRNKPQPVAKVPLQIPSYPILVAVGGSPGLFTGGILYPLQ